MFIAHWGPKRFLSDEKQIRNNVSLKTARRKTEMNLNLFEIFASKRIEVSLQLLRRKITDAENFIFNDIFS
jgi:hypothetical protein